MGSNRCAEHPSEFSGEDCRKCYPPEHKSLAEDRTQALRAQLAEARAARDRAMAQSNLDLEARRQASAACRVAKTTAEDYRRALVKKDSELYDYWQLRERMIDEADQLRARLSALETCQTCDGDGLMDVVVKVLPDGSEEYEPVECAECDGSGIGHFASVVRERDELRAKMERLKHVRDEIAALYAERTEQLAEARRLVAKLSLSAAACGDRGERRFWLDSTADLARALGMRSGEG